MKKKNTAHAVQAKDFVGVKRRQNRSGVLRGGTFFLGNHPLKVVVITVRTTTFVSRIWNKGYHESVGASILFCEIYCGKAVIVGLMKSHIGGKFLLLTNKCRVQKQILWQMNKNIENEMLL